MLLSTYMVKLYTQIRRFFKQIRGLFPSPLPTGSGAFDLWADDIASTYTLPTEDRDSILFSFSTMIMHLGPTTANKSRYYFVLALRAAAAKQVAGAAFQDIKTRQRDSAVKQQEATVPPTVAHAISQT